MPSFRLALSLAAIIGAAPAAPAYAQQAQSGRYMFDIVKQEPYKSSWLKILKPLGKPQKWLQEADGPSNESKRIAIDGADWEVANTCKNHDCGDNRAIVLFGAGGKTAVAVLSLHGKPQYLGDPTPAEKAALDKADSE